MQARNRFKRLYPDERARDMDYTVISIGAGTRIKSSAFYKLKRAGKLKWAGPAISISMNGTSQSTHKLLSDYFETTDGDLQYYRMQTVLFASESGMDDPAISQLLRDRLTRPSSCFWLWV